MKLKRIAFPLLLFAMSLSALFAIRTSRLAVPQEPAQAPAEVGKETCLACHDDKNVLALTPHATQECEGCHGPGSVHVEAGGGEPIPFKGAHSEATTLQCLSCHRSNHDIAAFRTAAHGRGQLSCVSCHRIHLPEARSPLLKTAQTELCTDCHSPIKAELRKPYHHPVLEGAMQCASCHNPHGNDAGPGLARAVLGGDEACVSCHADKRGPFAFEHAPLQIHDCQTCHQPHGSINARMLIRTQVHLLCLECHTRSAAAATSQPPSFHDLRSPRYRNCTTCHREIHGSNASPLFLR